MFAGSRSFFFMGIFYHCIVWNYGRWALISQFWP